MVPTGYQSSFVVESRNYAPMSCQGSICDHARKTWDDNNRRIEYGTAKQGWPGDVPRSLIKPDKLAALGFKMTHTSDDAVRISVAEVAREVFG